MGFFSGSKGEVSAVFDIGPQNIGAALVLKKPGDACRIIWSHREAFADEKERTPRELLEVMISSLKKVNETLQKDAVAGLSAHGLPSLSAVHCVLSSPWIELEEKTITRAFEKSAIITKKIIRDALSEEKKSAEPSEFAVVEKTVTGLKLNGYMIRNPFGKKASSLEVSFTKATAPAEILNLIEESVSVKRPDIQAFSSVACRAIKTLFQTDDFMFLTIENNFTELSVTKDAILALHESVFSGSDALVGAVAKECGVSFAEARSLVGLTFKKDIDKAMAEKIRHAVEGERASWLQEIQKSIESTGRLTVLPRTAYFIGSDIGFVADIVEHQTITEFGINQLPLDIIVLNSASLKNSVVFGDADYADIRLGLITVALCGTRTQQ